MRIIVIPLAGDTQVDANLEIYNCLPKHGDCTIIVY